MLSVLLLLYHKNFSKLQSLQTILSHEQVWLVLNEKSVGGLDKVTQRYFLHREAAALYYHTAVICP